MAEATYSDLPAGGSASGDTGTVKATGGLVGFLPYIFLFSLALPILIPVGSVLLMPHRLVLLVLFVPLLLALLRGKAGRPQVFDYLFFGSAIWGTIAIFVSDGEGAVEWVGLHWLEFIGSYLIGRVCIRNSQDVIRFVRAYGFLLLLLTPFAVAESFMHRAFFLELIPNSISTVVAPERWGLRRAQVAFSHPILFGVFASTAFGLFVYAIRSVSAKIILLAAAGISTIMSLSTGALISLSIQSYLIAWELITRPSRYRWWIFSGLAVAGYIAIDLLSNRTPFHVLAEYASFSSHSAWGRIIIWEYGTQNVAEHPWFGLGLNVHNWVRPAWKSASVDNYWLMQAMTYGLPALILYAAAVFMIIRRVAIAKLAGKKNYYVRAGYLTCLGGILIASGTVHNWHAMEGLILFLFGAGVWMTWNKDAAGGETDLPAAPEQADRSPRYTRFENDSEPVAAPEVQKNPQGRKELRFSRNHETG